MLLCCAVICARSCVLSRLCCVVCECGMKMSGGGRAAIQEVRRGCGSDATATAAHSQCSHRHTHSTHSTPRQHTYIHCNTHISQQPHSRAPHVSRRRP